MCILSLYATKCKQIDIVGSARDLFMVVLVRLGKLDFFSLSLNQMCIWGNEKFIFIVLLELFLIDNLYKSSE